MYFIKGKINIVVATDVAARGIHIKRLQYVVNYDFPTNIEQYCHRIGRCGRQGEEGEAYSLLTRNLAPLANDLICLLRQCKQEVEPNLIKLYEEYSQNKDTFLKNLSNEEQIEVSGGADEE